MIGIDTSPHLEKKNNISRNLELQGDSIFQRKLCMSDSVVTTRVHSLYKNAGLMAMLSLWRKFLYLERPGPGRNSDDMVSSWDQSINFTGTVCGFSSNGSASYWPPGSLHTLWVGARIWQRDWLFMWINIFCVKYILWTIHVTKFMFDVANMLKNYCQRYANKNHELLKIHACSFNVFWNTDAPNLRWYAASTSPNIH